ncbi:VOC family protein [Streptomyces sp. MnatMP-M17]|uniref:VOC family protein n=1 Tax=Streptomyces sp. MnatMP-M17 TaxID=1839780 RepID=UPI0035208FD5
MLIDYAEPERVARFWCEVLGYVVSPPPDGFATWDDFDRSRSSEDQGSWFACSDPLGAGPRLFFQRVPEGKVVKNRLHLHRDAGHRGQRVLSRLSILRDGEAGAVSLGSLLPERRPEVADDAVCGRRGGSASAGRSVRRVRVEWIEGAEASVRHGDQ